MKAIHFIEQKKCMIVYETKNRIKGIFQYNVNTSVNKNIVLQSFLSYSLFRTFS